MAKKETPPVTDSFTGKPLTDTFSFPENDSLTSSFSELPVKQERLVDFSDDVKPNLLSSEQAVKEEIDIKEQDNAVAALLKQEEEEAKVNEYINNEEKQSVLLFDEFDHHIIKEDAMKNSTSDYLLTPESYNIALQSVVSSNT